MAENRKRTAVDHPAQIYCHGMSIGCTVANISANGAAIDIPNPHQVVDRFQLVTEHGRVVLNCRVLWIKKNRVGVTFE